MHSENLKTSIASRLKLTEMSLHDTRVERDAAQAKAAGAMRCLRFALFAGMLAGVAFGVWGGWLIWGA